MFKTFIKLAMIITLIISATGCSVMKSTGMMRENSTIEELANIPRTFAAIYGESGMEALFEPGYSAEKYANISLLLSEPGFIIIMSRESREKGIDNKLISLFKREIYELLRTKEMPVTQKEYFYYMYFGKIGKRVQFIEE